jgi:hypothetical protein
MTRPSSFFSRGGCSPLTVATLGSKSLQPAENNCHLRPKLLKMGCLTPLSDEFLTTTFVD